MSLRSCIGEFRTIELQSGMALAIRTSRTCDIIESWLTGEHILLLNSQLQTPRSESESAEPEDVGNEGHDGCVLMRCMKLCI
jgi:hypothetical protein